MKHVTKSHAPAPFETWKAQASDEWQPSYRQLANPEKRNVHVALLAEQGWVCCYCGREIGVRDSHIEHFRPQSAYASLELAYENMHVSCLRHRESSTPLHCGHAKSDAFDEAQIIDPQDPTCEARFIYNVLGHIAPTDSADSRAAYMSGLLKLDSPILKAMRAEVIAAALGPDVLEALSDAELRTFRDACRARNAQGKLSPLGHVLARYAEQYMGPSVERSR